MSSVTEVVITGLLAPVIVLLLKKFLEGYGKYLLAPRPPRKNRFDKVPTDTKVKVLAKINTLLKSDKLREHPSSSNRMVQIKFLYEQTGIYMPVWHCHQLIAFMAAENISSLDVRLSGFLNNTFIGRFPVKGFSVNDRLVTRFYMVVVLYGLFSAALFAGVGWLTISPFREHQQPVLFIFFTLLYFLAFLSVVGYLIGQFTDIRQGVKFCQMFEEWLRHNAEEVSSDTLRSHKFHDGGTDG
ncbi:TPA: hypothetical protein P5S08_004209 [Salmonella enterica subsp. enterica serovar Concord]|nr:hypothetical protein [Salmonella enterica subsp. enterica serovar Concord]